MVTVLIGGVSPSFGAVRQSNAEAYRGCPAAGVSRNLVGFLWSGGQDAKGPAGHLDVRWAGEAGWIAPDPVSEAELLDPATWVRPDSALEKHVASRGGAGLSVPQGANRILLWARTEHWAWYSESTVATRGGDGVWAVDYVRLYDDGNRQHRSWTLTVADAARLDSLLADPCLAREPFRSRHADLMSSDNTQWVLEADSPVGVIRIAGVESGFGRAGGILYLLRNTQ